MIEDPIDPSTPTAYILAACARQQSLIAQTTDRWLVVGICRTVEHEIRTYLQFGVPWGTVAVVGALVETLGVGVARLEELERDHTNPTEGVE